MIRLTDGRIISCGNNDAEQLGYGDRVTRTLFEEVKAWKVEINVV